MLTQFTSTNFGSPDPGSLTLTKAHITYTIEMDM